MGPESILNEKSSHLPLSGFWSDPSIELLRDVDIWNESLIGSSGVSSGAKHDINERMKRRRLFLEHCIWQPCVTTELHGGRSRRIATVSLPIHRLQRWPTARTLSSNVLRESRQPSLLTHTLELQPTPCPPVHFRGWRWKNTGKRAGGKKFFSFVYGPLEKEKKLPYHQRWCSLSFFIWPFPWGVSKANHLPPSHPGPAPGQQHLHVRACPD